LPDLAAHRTRIGHDGIGMEIAFLVTRLKAGSKRACQVVAGMFRSDLNSGALGTSSRAPFAGEDAALRLNA
jgi:hypothetical protein